ncbi:MAG: M23 family metallopeptidase [Chloroflexota bacterium]
MPRPLFDSEYIFGIHEPGGERHMIEASRPGWIVFTEELGHDPNNHSGKNFTQWSNQNLGIIARLNNGYGSTGTIPNSQHYGSFAQRCANFVRNSRGCKIWIIGNEMNYEVERPPASSSRAASPAPESAHASTPETSQPATSQPITPEPAAPPSGFWQRFLAPLLRFLSGGMGDAQLYSDGQKLSELGDPLGRGNPERFSALNRDSLETVETFSGDGLEAAAATARSTKEVITPQLYAHCYRLCRDAIHSVPGHEDDQVLIGSVAPWNAQTQYPGNLAGDWIQYFRDILNELGSDGCDGITIHTYTHGADPNLIHDESRMDPPFQNYHFQFRTYQDFMNAVPLSMRHLPVYITETDEDDPWLNRNIGWVQRAYGEIDHWNKQPGNQQIRALILYRWPQIDKWFIEGKQGVIDDFKEALRFDYRWQVSTPDPLVLRTGSRVNTLDIVNMRRSAGYRNKPIGDILSQIPQDSVLEILDGQPTHKDDLVWWRVRAKSRSGRSVDGWLAQGSPTGIPLLEPTTRGLSLLDQIGSGTPTSISPVPPPPTTITPPTTTKPTTPAKTEPTSALKTGRTLDIVRMRRTPGFRNKGIGDIITDIPFNTSLQVLSGPRVADELKWWEVKGKDSLGATVQGWMAEATSDGTRLLEFDDEGSSGDSPSIIDPRTPTSATGQFALGDRLQTLTIVRLRRTPGYRNQPAVDVVADVGKDTEATVIGGPLEADGLIWWNVNTVNPSGAAVSGWMAESFNGNALLAKGSTEESAQGEEAKFTPGQQLRTLDIVRMRKTPGFFRKPSSDIVFDVPNGQIVTVLRGPQNADGLAWWDLETTNDQNQKIKGWMAESLANGILLLEAIPTGNGDDTTNPDVGGTTQRFSIGDAFKTTDIVRMRRTPGYFDKPALDVLADIPFGTAGSIVGGPLGEDDLVWWNVQATGSSGEKLTGWMAEDSPAGTALIQKIDANLLPPIPTGQNGVFVADELVVTADAVNVRKTAGYINKPSSDILGGFRSGTTLNIIQGPATKDDLTWWRAGGITPNGPDGERIGWVAEAAGGNQLLIDAPKLPGTDIPDKATHTYLGSPTDRVFAIGQLWGENPQFYNRFAPGGVPLLGHNGIDYFTPVGSNLISVDNGTVLVVGNDPNGFGIYVIISHAWGQSIYAHMSRASVQRGQSVGRGTGLGQSGNTGTSTGPHLHFAIRINPFSTSDGWGGFRDPLPYLPPESIIMPSYVLISESRDEIIPTAPRIDPSGITEEVEL